MPGRRKVLWITVATQLSTITGAPTEDASAENQWKTLKTVGKKSRLKRTREDIRTTKIWISATNLQRPAKAMKNCSSGGLKPCGLRHAATCWNRTDLKRYWIGSTEKMDVASGTGDFGRPFGLIRYALNGRYKPEFASRNTTGPLIPERNMKIGR